MELLTPSLPVDPLQAALGNMGFKPKAPEPAAPAVTPAAPADKGATLHQEIKAQLEEKGAIATEKPAAPAPVETKKEEPAVMDEGQILSGKLGGRFKSFTELETSYTELEKKAASDPFVNPVVKGLNDYVKGGGDPEIYMRLQKMDLEKMSPRDLAVHQLMLQKNYNKEEAELLVDHKYKVNSPLTDEDGNPIEGVREAQLELKGVAHDAKEYLNGFKTEHLVPPATKAAEASLKAFEAASPSIAGELKEFKVTVGEDTHVVPVSEDAHKEAMSTLKEMVSSGMLDIDLTTPEGKASASAIAMGIAKSFDFDRTITAIADAIKTKALEEQHHVRKATGNSELRVSEDNDQKLFNILDRAYRGQKP